MLTRSAASICSASDIPTHLLAPHSPAKQRRREDSRSEGDSSASGSEEDSSSENLDQSPDEKLDYDSLILGDTEVESQAERLNRINTLYDSEDEEMEMEIGRSVVEDVNEKMVEEAEAAERQRDYEEYEEESQRQHDLQFPEAVNKQYALEIQYLIENWDEEHEDEDWDEGFDDALEKRMDDWQDDWQPDMGMD